MDVVGSRARLPYTLHLRNNVKSMAITHVVRDAAGEEYPASKKLGASLAKGAVSYEIKNNVAIF